MLLCIAMAAIRTTTDCPHHQLSLCLASACEITSTEFPKKVRATAREIHSKMRFCVGVTSSWAVFLTKLRVGSVAGSGLPPGPVVVGLAMLVFEFVATMLRKVKAARKKTSINSG